MEAYNALIKEVREIALLGSINSLLGWDEHVNLPHAGAPHRAEQVSLIARLHHERFTSPRVGELLAQVESSNLVGDPESDAGANARELRREYDRATKLPASLIELIGKIAASGKRAPVQVLEGNFPTHLQEKFGKLGAEAIGFDFDAGRLDTTVHPFCSGIAGGDTRITTRYNERSFIESFMGVLHETGHALYEQGLPKAEHFGEPIAEAISLGIHESQSRLWENLVGRRKSFWRFFLPKAREIFGASLRDVNERDWYCAINEIRPSLIRVESDEATYNLHILLRFELEQALVTNDLNVPDLPGAWNERMQKYLGITPPDDARGCLQDIHWSLGSIGYFATYTL